MSTDREQAEHRFVVTRTGHKAKRWCTRCGVTWHWETAGPGWVENPPELWRTRGLTGEAGIKCGGGSDVG